MYKHEKNGKYSQNFFAISKEWIGKWMKFIDKLKN
jgi:hypothetical protein